MTEAAKEYGGALFALAEEEGIDEQILEDVRSVRALLEEDPGYIKLLSTVSILKSDRVALIDQAFSGNVHPYLCSFLKLLTERGHSSTILDCCDVYEKLYCEANHIIRASVISAVPLTEEQRQRLQDTLNRRTGKNVEITYEIDPSLIGGMKVTVDSMLMEDTIRARLDHFRDKLDKITL